MLSSMTPTILAKDGQLFMVTGSPGGRTIINTVLETIVDVVDFGMNAQEAIDAPRFHHQWLPDRIDYEKYGLSPDTTAELERRGHTLRVGGGQGVAQVIVYNAKEDMLEGGTDRRAPRWRGRRGARAGRAGVSTASPCVDEPRRSGAPGRRRVLLEQVDEFHDVVGARRDPSASPPATRGAAPRAVSGRATIAPASTSGCTAQRASAATPSPAFTSSVIASVNCTSSIARRDAGRQQHLLQHPALLPAADRCSSVSSRSSVRRTCDCCAKR